MKKLLILSLFVLVSNILFCQEDIDTNRLRFLINSINNMPNEFDDNHGGGEIFRNYVSQNTLNFVNLKKYCKTVKTKLNIEVCCANKFELTYVEFEVPTIIRSIGANQEVNKNAIFDIYKIMYEQLLEIDKDFHKIKEFTLEYSGDYLIGNQVYVNKYKVWYYKITSWNCNNYGY
jgi:hypothetical protein